MSDLKCVTHFVKYLVTHADALDEADINAVAQVKIDLAGVVKRVAERCGDLVETAGSSIPKKDVEHVWC